LEYALPIADDLIDTSSRLKHHDKQMHQTLWMQ